MTLWKYNRVLNDITQSNIWNRTFEETICSELNVLTQRVVTNWCHMVKLIRINIGSWNDLLPDDTKNVPELMLTYHQICSATFTWQQLQRCTHGLSNMCSEVIFFIIASSSSQRIKQAANTPPFRCYLYTSIAGFQTFDISMSNNLLNR